MSAVIAQRMVLASTILALSGCLHVPTEAHFEPVRAGIEDRTGVSVSRPSGSARRALLPDDLRSLLSDELTLDEAVRIALLNNGRLLAEYEALDMASAEWLQMRLLPNPGVEGLVLISEHDSDKRVWEVGGDWNVLEVMLLPLKRRLADDQLSIAQLRTTMAVMELIYQVRNEYHTLQAAQQEYNLRETVAASAKAAYEMAQRLREAGNIKEIDVIKQRALYEQMKVDLSAAEFAVTQPREALNSLLGLWGEDARWEVASVLPEVPAEALDSAELEFRVIENSLDLAVARNQIQAMARRLGIARTTAVIPRLHLGVDAEREPDDTWLIGPKVVMELPVFDFGQADRPRAKAALRRNWYDYGQLAVDIRAAARTAFERARLARQRALYYRDVVVPLRERITHRTQLQYNAMQLGVFHLIESKQMEIDARRRHIEELRTYWLARNDLEQLLNGRLVAGSAAAISVDPAAGMGGGGDGGH